MVAPPSASSLSLSGGHSGTGDASQSSFLPSVSKIRPPTLRPLYNPTDSDIEHYLTWWITEPILHHCIPRWITPNTITAINATTCWTLLATAYIAWAIEDRHPLPALMLRLVCAVFVFCSMLMDCLDGMQARRTSQGSLLGELLDHSFDAAHTCIFAVVMLTILQPDFLTACFSLVCTGMVYNAQLVLYRHRKRMINPPTNGPEAQLLLIAAVLLFATFFYAVPRGSGIARGIVSVFSVFANIAQCNNIRFFFNKLHFEFAPHSYVGAHLRFAATVFGLALLAYANLISVGMYWFAFIAVAYRWNAHHLLFTILQKYVHTGAVEQGYRDTEHHWNREVVVGIAAIAVVNGALFEPGSWAFELFPLVFSLAMLGRNLLELVFAMPLLAEAQRRAKEKAQLGSPRSAELSAHIKAGDTDAIEETKQ